MNDPNMVMALDAIASNINTLTWMIGLDAFPVCLCLMGIAFAILFPKT